MRVAAVPSVLMLAATIAAAQTLPSIRPDAQATATSQTVAATQPLASTQPLPPPTLVDATLVSIHLHDVSPGVVFAELARQGNTEFSVNPPNLWNTVVTKVSVDVDREPFWKALQDVCLATGMRTRVGRAVDRITIRPGLVADYPSIIRGPFSISATGVQYRSEVQLQPPAANRRESWLRLQVDCEPRFPIMHGEIELLGATDSNGNSVLPEQNVHDLSSDEADWSVSANVPIRYTPGQADHFQIRGVAHVAIQTRSVRGEVEDVLHAGGKEFAAGPYRLRIDEVQSVARGAQIWLVLTRSDHSDANAAPLEVPLDRMVMLDAQGRRLQLQRVASGNSITKDESRTSLLFSQYTFEGEDTGAPSKLIWELPTEIQTVDVPFELKDLPLP